MQCGSNGGVSQIVTGFAVGVVRLFYDLLEGAQQKLLGEYRQHFRVAHAVSRIISFASSNRIFPFVFASKAVSFGGEKIDGEIGHFDVVLRKGRQRRARESAKRMIVVSRNSDLVRTASARNPQSTMVRRRHNAKSRSVVGAKYRSARHRFHRKVVGRLLEADGLKLPVFSCERELQ